MRLWMGVQLSRPWDDLSTCPECTWRRRRWMEDEWMVDSAAKINWDASFGAWFESKCREFNSTVELWFSFSVNLLLLFFDVMQHLLPLKKIQETEIMTFFLQWLPWQRQTRQSCKELGSALLSIHLNKEWNWSVDEIPPNPPTLYPRPSLFLSALMCVCICWGSRSVYQRPAHSSLRWCMEESELQ